MTFEQSAEIDRKIKYCRILEELLVADPENGVIGVEYRLTYPEGDEEAYDEILHIIYKDDSTVGILVTGLSLTAIAVRALRAIR